MQVHWPHVGERSHVETWRWWAFHQLIYNFGLIAAGALAWVLATTLIFTLGMQVFVEDGEGPEFTILMLFVQGFAGLVFLVLANLCYLIGPFGELVLRPREPDRYRRVCWRTGFVFSMLVPFAYPALVVLGLLEKGAA